jgi:transposase-like protein
MNPNPKNPNRSITIAEIATEFSRAVEEVMRAARAIGIGVVDGGSKLIDAQAARLKVALAVHRSRGNSAIAIPQTANDRTSSADASRARLAREFGVSATQVHHHQVELGMSDAKLRSPNGKAQLAQYLGEVMRGKAVVKSARTDKHFVWRFGKETIIDRAFARCEKLRRAAEAVALSACASVEVRADGRLEVNGDGCRVVLEGIPEGLLVVTAHAAAPFTDIRFLDVAARVRRRVTVADLRALLELS